jgi:hypothetical protein
MGDKRKYTDDSDDEERSYSAEELARFTDTEFDQLFQSVKGNESKRFQYAMKLCIAAGQSADRFGYLLDWCNKFRKAEDHFSHQAKPLGSEMPYLGYGSSAGSYEAEVRAVVDECDREDNDYKGLALAHYYYRRFLKHIHGTLANTSGSDNDERGAVVDEESNQVDDDDDNTPFDDDNEDDNSVFKTIVGIAELEVIFSQGYDLIFKDTKIGVVSKKTGQSLTHETCASSILCAYINKAISATLHAVSVQDDHTTPFWCSEYTLHKSGGCEVGSAGNEEGKGENKCPRCDGLLFMADPISENCLRPLVMMEAKCDWAFDGADDLQSMSNACDAMSLRKERESPWPLLVFRWAILPDTVAVQVLAMVPIDTRRCRLVPLWQENNSEPIALYKSVMAAVFAAMEFQERLTVCNQQLPFCKVTRNVAFQAESNDGPVKFAYKSFIETKTRNDNFKFVKTYVDPDVKKVQLENMGCWLKMKYLGDVIPPNYECTVDKFIDIGKALSDAHSHGICHGDLRLQNLILGAETGSIIDWDLAGQEGQTMYPASLLIILDGARHDDVLKAINNKTIGDLPLSKAHDWFSLQKVMELFEPIDQKFGTAWECLIRDIADDSKRNADREKLTLRLKIQHQKGNGPPKQN